jgi:dienelactone hydrolase
MPTSILSRRILQRNTTVSMAIGSLLVGLALCFQSATAHANTLDERLNEQVVMVPGVSGNDSVQLETTIFKPPGSGPFPILVMNHGKALGDPHMQPRDRFIVISREFVKHGYAVVIPMRKGFARSSGTYTEKACDMAANAQTQAEDLQSVLNYIGSQRWADKNRVVVAGQSYGGLATMAFGTRGFPGVKGLINFAGGLKIHGGSCQWQNSLVSAFAEFGKNTMVPSLWFYGENDSHFGPDLARRMHGAYTQSGGNAQLVAFGQFKRDAHGMSSSWDGIKIWWPETKRFLQAIGMPTEPVLALDDDPRLQRTDYAAIENVDAVPHMRDTGREAYRTFLTKSMPRAFAISSSGAWSWAEDGDDPVAQVISNCQRSSGETCKLYAYNDYVVWSDASTMAGNQDTPAATDIQNITPVAGKSDSVSVAIKPAEGETVGK